MKARNLAVLAAGAVVVGLLLFWRQPRSPERSAGDATSVADAEAPAGAPPATGGPDVTLQLRDLADGSPLPRFGVRIGERTIETDDAGRLRLPVGREAALAPTDPAFVLVPASTAEALAEGTLWAYRDFLVRGRVSGGGVPPLDPARAFIEATWEEEKGAEPPRTWLWLSAHEVTPESWFAEGFRAGGTFQMELPRVPGFHVRATAEGWRPASATLNVDGGTEVVEVDLVLLPAFRVHGIVADTKGRPLAGATIFVHIVRRGEPPEDGQEETYWEGQITRRRLSDGTLIASFGGVTDPRGRFDLAVDTEGQGFLQVQRAGHVPHHRALGLVSGDTEAEVTLEPGRGASVRVLRGGAAANETWLYLTDLDLPVPPVFFLRTDAEGNAPADWLVAGHRYTVFLDGVRGARQLSWSGQAEIDVSALPEARPP